MGSNNSTAHPGPAGPGEARLDVDRLLHAPLRDEGDEPGARKRRCGKGFGAEHRAMCDQLEERELHVARKASELPLARLHEKRVAKKRASQECFASFDSDATDPALPRIDSVLQESGSEGEDGGGLGWTSLFSTQQSLAGSVVSHANSASSLAMPKDVLSESQLTLGSSSGVAQHPSGKGAEGRVPLPPARGTKRQPTFRSPRRADMQRKDEGSAHVTPSTHASDPAEMAEAEFLVECASRVSIGDPVEDSVRRYTPTPPSSTTSNDPRSPQRQRLASVCGTPQPLSLEYADDLAPVVPSKRACVSFSLPHSQEGRVHTHSSAPHADVTPPKSHSILRRNLAVSPSNASRPGSVGSSSSAPCTPLLARVGHVSPPNALIRRKTQ